MTCRAFLDALEWRLLLSTSLQVVPITTPTDATHFHSLALAVAASSPAGNITILDGAEPDTDIVLINKTNLTIQGDTRVAASSLPRDSLTANAQGITLNHLCIQYLTIDSGLGLATVRGCDIISIDDASQIAAGGGYNTFDGNSIHGSFLVEGNAISQPADIFESVTHNRIAAIGGAYGVSATNIRGFTFTDNTLITDGTTNALSAMGSLQNFLIARNHISGNPSTAGGIIVGLVNVAASGSIIDNTIIQNNLTKGGSCLNIGAATNGSAAIRVQGNTFQGRLGVDYSGATTADTLVNVDLGGGSQGSLGGNNFRSFTGGTGHYALEIGGVGATATLVAKNNIFKNDTASPTFLNAALGMIQATALTSAQAFIANTYEALLHRGPLANDYSYWTGVYNASGQSAVVNSIAHSAEALGVIIDGYYRAYLTRGSDSNGLNFWVTSVQAGATLESVQTTIVSSTEFIAGHNADFVQSLYRSILNRTAGTSDIAFWYTQIPAQGLSGVAASILASGERRTDVATAFFQLYLHRTPGVNDLAFFDTIDTLTALSSVLGSNEFFTVG